MRNPVSATLKLYVNLAESLIFVSARVSVWFQCAETAYFIFNANDFRIAETIVETMIKA